MSLLTLSLLVLTLSLGLGLLRVFIGPSVEDRMLSVQLMGTNGVALLLLLGFLLESPANIDVALVLSLLAAVSVAALTRQKPEEGTEDD